MVQCFYNVCPIMRPIINKFLIKKMFLISIIIGFFLVQARLADDLKSRPLLQEILVPKNLKENQTFRLLCALTQGESVRFEWFHDGNKLIDSEKRKIRFNSDDSSELIIKSLSVDDLGEIKCLAKNDYGEDAQTVQLIMNVRPRWTVEPEDVMGTLLKNEIVLECDAKAYPTPTIHWLQLDDKKQTMIKRFESNIIKFELNKETAGFYKCVANNPFGSIEKIVSVGYHGK